MVPLNTFTPSAVVSAYLPPLTDDYDPLTMRAPGGVAIGDGSQGRETQFWTVSYDAATDVISVTPASTGSPFTLTVADVLSVCLAFDNNMAVALAYMKADGAYLYFFNGLHNAYETLQVPGATSCRVCVDKTTSFYNAGSDVIFAYTLGGTVSYRQQRDRYAIAYDVGPASGVLTRVGPSAGNRLQLEIQPSA